MYSPEIIAKNLERARKRGIALTRRSPDIVRAEAARLNSLWDEKNRKLLRNLTKGEEEFIECEQTLCRFDFRHWASCYGFCEVDASEGGGLSPVKFWQGQRRVLDLMGKRELEMYDEYAREKRVSAGILVILHKIRQCGITALWRLILQHRGTICHKNFRCMSSTLASPDDEFKKALYNRDRVIYDNLPYYLKPALAYDVKKEQLQYEKMGRFVYTDSGQQAGIGTGNQWDGHHITECALWQEQLDRLIFSLLPGIPKGLNVIGGWESTADGRGNPWHDLTESVRWQKRGFEHWVYAFIPWWQASEKYADPCPPLHVFSEVTLKHAEMVEATSPEFNDGKPYRLTREQMFWWEGQYFYHKERRALGMFYSNYPATPEESFQSVHKGALSYEVLESIRHTAHVKGMPYEVKLGATQLTDGGSPRVHSAEHPMPNSSSFANDFYVGSRGSLHKLPLKFYDDDPRGLLWLWEPPDVARYRYFLGCLPDGELVRTDSGEKRIETVTRADRLLDMDGEYVEVAQRMRRKYVGDLIEVDLYGAAGPVCFTPEHPIFTTSKIPGNKSCQRAETVFDWKKAGELKEHDWVRYPIANPRPLSGLEIMEHWPTMPIRPDFKKDPHMMLDVDFWWVVGLWLGDGHLCFEKEGRGASVHISFNEKVDKHNIERFKRVGKDLFKAAIHTRTRGNCTEVQFSSIEMAGFLWKEFGDSAATKYIPHWIKQLPVDYCSALVEGYWESDGCIEGNRLIVFTSISLELLKGIQDLLLRLNVFGGIRVLREPGVTDFGRWQSATQRTFELNISGEKARQLLRLWKSEAVKSFHRPRSRVDRHYSFIVDGYLYLRIHKIHKRKFDGYVNNFETATHTYCAGLISTHNCDPSHGITGWTRAGRNEADVDTDNSTIWVLREGKKAANEPDLIQVGEYAAPVDAFDIGFIANIIGRIFGREDEDGQAKLCHEAFPGPGPGTTRTLIECGYTNLWHWEYFAGATVAPTQTVGWQASPRNNTALWEKSKRLLSLPNNIAIKSPWTYEELASAVVLPGKFWPEVIRGNGRHDDRLRACQLAMWAAKGWSLDAETVVEHVRTDPTPIDWAATDMSMEQIHDAWNDHFDKMYGQ